MHIIKSINLIYINFDANDAGYAHDDEMLSQFVSQKVLY